VLRQMQVKLLVRPKDIKAATKSWRSTIICTTPGVESTCAIAVVLAGALAGVGRLECARVASQGPGCLIGWTEGARRERLSLESSTLALYVLPPEPLPPIWSAGFMRLMLGR